MTKYQPESSPPRPIRIRIDPPPSYSITKNTSKTNIKNIKSLLLQKTNNNFFNHTASSNTTEPTPTSTEPTS